MKPEIGSKHRVYWTPMSGDVKRSDVWVTVLSVSDKSYYLRPTGQPVLVVTPEQWDRMVTQ